MADVLCLTLNPALDLSIELGELHPGAVNRAEHSRLDAAGKGHNVARLLAALGHRVCAGGLLGADNDAPFIAAFKDWGVEDACLRVPGSTRVNVKLSERDGRVSDINGPGIAVIDAQLDDFEIQLSHRLHRIDACVIAGSLPPGFALERFTRLVALVVAHGVPVWLDTSGAALGAGMEGRPTMVKPNEDELAEWLGVSLDPDDRPALVDACEQLLDCGVDEAVVSLGAKGVLWRSREQGLLAAYPPSVEVKSTVCAGDTLLGGLLHARLAGFDAERSLAFATALAAECVRHVGVGDPSCDDFSALVAATRVERLDPSPCPERTTTARAPRDGESSQRE
ncbi:1-phosphofructokinase family hexose kinase [Halotalea alkalilenta]|uniref:1-phosphofructokinase family hexose kinase n=1 Tax=Halotalea alkalilenta TaxID=376489 RepID=UPI0006949E6D|nr:1-phosphofructokinase [Halotalea alkalilenta]